MLGDLFAGLVTRRSEGGDSDTRRRAAADLVRALTDTFEAQVTELFTGYVGALLQVRVYLPVNCLEGLSVLL